MSCIEESFIEKDPPNHGATSQLEGGVANEPKVHME